jgi:hypothetical protein
MTFLKKKTVLDKMSLNKIDFDSEIRAASERHMESHREECLDSKMTRIAVRKRTYLYLSSLASMGS